MIEFSHVDKRFGEKVVLRDLNFRVEKGEVFTLIGPSGSGKTTILRLINLLDDPSSGTISFDGEYTAVANREKVGLRRRMAMVFQKPIAIRGNVFDNVAIGLVFRRVERKEIKDRVLEALDLVGLSGYEERKASTLSGGELQRVAIARALVTKPEVILLDEPTANLDPLSTEKIEGLIHSLVSRFGTTIVLSTHDMIQGQRLATRLAVVLEGSIGQVGDSHEIFYKPVNREVARMVGVENVLEGRISKNEDGLASIDVQGIPIAATCPYGPGSEVTIFLRPEDVVFMTERDGRSSARNELSGTISRVIPLGPMVKVRVDAGIPVSAVITRRSYDEMGLAAGKEIVVAFKATAIHVVAKKT
ncbi:MAG: ABC transporter ATP-binding protein [Methanolinea sp.]|nr:ABC transporter ATP-binding protein [Methanolinea sp.]